MNNAIGSALISAPAHIVRDTLLAATRLPEWNPAFIRVDGPARATVGTDYDLEGIRSLHGSLTYTRIDAHEIVMAWRVPLLSETGTWMLEQHGPGVTRVTHTVERRGALALALAHTLDTLPPLRLERLEQRVGASQLV